LIDVASAQWSKSGVSRFVLTVELILAACILILALIFLIKKKKKPVLFLIFLGFIFLLCFVIYLIIPNPYEFTHLPEYALLSILLILALKSGKRFSQKESEKTEKNAPFLKNPFFLSIVIVSLIGITDEIYQYFLPGRFFTIYDIFLNSLGGFLGTLIIGDI
jgi:carbon starvation protein CstA